MLTGLAESCETSGGDNNFSSSLILVSSVSGGSVGNMYVVGSYDSDGRLRKDLMQVIRDDAARTSLSAVGWGILYPDFVRTVPLVGSFLAAHGFGEDVDRGWALEIQWFDHWDGRLWKTPPTISEWSKEVAVGKRPAAIFNARWSSMEDSTNDQRMEQGGSGWQATGCDFQCDGCRERSAFCDCLHFNEAT